MLDFEITKQGRLKRNTGGEEHASDQLKLLYAIYEKLEAIEKSLEKNETNSIVSELAVTTAEGTPLPPIEETPTESSVLNLNTATFDELITLPDIGEVTAQKIMEGRPYKTLAQVKRAVKGVDWNAIASLIEVVPVE